VILSIFYLFSIICLANSVHLGDHEIQNLNRVRFLLSQPKRAGWSLTASQ